MPDRLPRTRTGLWRGFRRWHGIVLCLAALVSTVWLAMTGQLILYIHPRYVVFTVIMAVVGLVLVFASFARAPDHDHEDDEKPGRVVRTASVAATVLTFVVAVGLVVVPPATLTTATADQRVINSTQVGASTRTVDSAASASNGTSSRYTVLDWSSLLRQTSDVGFYRDKPADVVGFITKDTDDPDNMFYVSRFVITCCAVDAQPVGVPVYQPNWKDSLSADEWVRVKGAFDTNPSSASPQGVVLLPSATTKVNQPREPYLY